MTSIVTKTGDNGTTGLLGGSRVSKASPRLHAYGTVDELNAILGLARTEKLPTAIAANLDRIQRQLFRLGTDLATPLAQNTCIERMEKEDVEELEQWIQKLEESLPTIKNFIIPGGCRATALLHCARAVCRRAERWTIALTEKEEVKPHARIYLNRLSDYFFLAARRANQSQK